jgi:hypothetical protein
VTATDSDLDGSIPGGETVHRRIGRGPEMVAVDTITGRRRPSSGAFKPDNDGVSVYRESTLVGVGLGWRDLLVTNSQLIVSLEVADVRTLAHLDVTPDPWPADIPDPTHARNAAHALIVGWGELSKNQRLTVQRALACLPSLRFQDESASRSGSGGGARRT